MNMKRVILMASLSLFPRLLVAQDFDPRSMVGEDWYGLYMRGTKSGYLVNRVTVAEDGTLTQAEDAHFRLLMNNVKQDMRFFSKRVYGPDGRLAQIESQVEDASGPSVFAGRVDGDTMQFVSTMGGASREQVLPRPEESLRDVFTQVLLVRSNGAKVGDEVRYKLFEPMAGEELKGVSRILGVEERMLDGAPTKVFKVKSDYMGVEQISYVTQDGTTLEDIFGGMMTARLEPEEVAKNVSYSNDVIVANAALVEEPLKSPRTRESLTLRLTGPLKPEHLFNDDRQSLKASGDGFEFAAKLANLKGFEAVRLPIQNEDVAIWMEPSVFVQSDNERLVTKAREIVGEETDALAASTLLCHWVYSNVRTIYSARLSNALEVLENLEGDCTEHSILFIGLARALGIPAREVAGLIYVDKAPHGFYFHQWAKVWVGRWIDVDPTFNQPVADVTHIKLAEGDLFKQNQLIPIIGRLQVEVVDEDEGGE